VFCDIFVLIGHSVAYQAVTSPQAVSNATQQIIDSPITIQQYFNVNPITTASAVLGIFSHWTTYESLITEQVVPIFIIILSFNQSLAFHRRGYTGVKDRKFHYSAFLIVALSFSKNALSHKKINFYR